MLVAVERYLSGQSRGVRLAATSSTHPIVRNTMVRSSQMPANSVYSLSSSQGMVSAIWSLLQSLPMIA